MLEKGNAAVDILKKKVIANKDKLAYTNLDQNNNYIGWVSNFNISLPDGELMKLDLRNESDLFFLFVIACAWSRSLKWENAVYFVIYLKINDIGPDKFLDEKFVNKEKYNASKSAKNIEKECSGLVPREKVSFRPDLYDSAVVLANKWPEIKENLKIASENNNYLDFINYIRSIKGLGYGKNSILIKIPLILRELRCQKIFDNIPGKYCCVVDSRVEKSAKKINLKIAHPRDVKSMLKASEIVYNNFGELYDIALFAYDDLV